MRWAVYVACSLEDEDTSTPSLSNILPDVLKEVILDNLEQFDVTTSLAYVGKNISVVMAFLQTLTRRVMKISCRNIRAYMCVVSEVG